MKFKNFHEAYLKNLNDVYYAPEFINQPRGNVSKERLNYSMILENPRQRICYTKLRKTNIIFNFAEALWYLSGSNDLEYISYYASNMKKYSMDGKSLTGTAYGPKIFSYGHNKINQWDRLIKLFKEDPDTKRGFIEIFDANEDLSLKNIDVSCTIGLQFFIREKKLYTTAFMRANDAFRGIISDVFSFTFIQEFLANQLNLDLGEYSHNVATTHVYEPDFKNTEKVLFENTIDRKEFYFPKMPRKDNFNDLKIVLQYEKELRENTIYLVKEDIDKLDIDVYWKQVLYLFSLYQQIHCKDRLDKEIYNSLEPIYQYLFYNKWNKHF
ncbi:thymidylate synthase [Clostridium oceanicum]|uniref:Thymidylate synthase n=1 Tax=Clostridium oceanicum TaxID=1543 RepID=A0ABN1JFC0_9CLOT